MNKAPMTLKKLIASDLERYKETYRLRGAAYSKTKVFWESLLLKAGFQALFLYRVSHWLFNKGLLYPAWFLTRMNILLTGAEIEFNARIGPACLIAHPVGLVIGRGTVLGERATLFQGVSFGARNWHPEAIGCFPEAGAHCFFFANAVVVGRIKIGDSCVIGANSVVTTDVPEGSLVAGNPARVIPDKGRESIQNWFDGFDAAPSGALMEKL